MLTPAERVARIQADLQAFVQVLPSLCPPDGGHVPYSVSVGVNDTSVHVPFGAFMDAHVGGLIGDVDTRVVEGVLGAGKQTLHYTGTLTAPLPSGTKVRVVACEDLPVAPSPDASG